MKKPRITLPQLRLPHLLRCLTHPALRPACCPAALLLHTMCRQEGEWPTYGNDDDRVDGLARDLVAAFHGKLAAQHTYRAALPTLRCVGGWRWAGAWVNGDGDGLRTGLPSPLFLVCEINQSAAMLLRLPLATPAASSQSPATWCTAPPPGTPPTAASGGSHTPPAPTPCTAAMCQGPLPPSTASPPSPMLRRWMASPTRESVLARVWAEAAAGA